MCRIGEALINLPSSLFQRAWDLLIFEYFKGQMQNVSNTFVSYCLLLLSELFLNTHMNIRNIIIQE